MDFSKLEQDLLMFEQDMSLLDPLNFMGRAEAIDLVDFIEQIEKMRVNLAFTGVANLWQRAKSLKQKLNHIDRQFCQTLRTGIQTDTCSAFDLRTLFEQAIQYATPNANCIQIGYNGLDILLDGLLKLDQVPKTTEPRHPEMVHLEPTPANIILTLVEQVHLRHTDVFYDLGAGLGHVAILIKLLTEAQVVGVEIEPAYIAYAEACIKALGLQNIHFVNEDAREADYTTGTVFFMFTPFKGEILQTVLTRLKYEAQIRPITLCTYGSCTQVVSEQTWLRQVDENEGHEYTLAIFERISLE